MKPAEWRSQVSLIAADLADTAAAVVISELHQELKLTGRTVTLSTKMNRFTHTDLYRVFIISNQNSQQFSYDTP